MTTAEMRAALGLDDSYSDLQVISQWALLNGTPPAPISTLALTPEPAALTPEQAALAAIRAAFADPEPLIYTQAGVALPPIAAIRSDEAAPSFEGPGHTARAISYEIYIGDLPARPKNSETFTHRDRIWRVGDVTEMTDVEAWRLVVTDAGPV